MTGYTCDVSSNTCVPRGSLLGPFPGSPEDGSAGGTDGGLLRGEVDGVSGAGGQRTTGAPSPKGDAAPAACAAPGTECGGVCVDLSSSQTHCGTCANACLPGEKCSTGVCVLDCVSPLVACGALCVSTTTDALNCGSCGNACSAPAGGIPSCVSSVCGFACLPGLSRCGETCVDLASDASNCGNFGHVCAVPTGGTVSCVLGVCTPACPLELTLCDGRCVDLVSDPKHCGSCAHHCKPDQSCTNAACSG